jgi:two-component system sensor kinase FixL
VSRGVGLRSIDLWGGLQVTKWWKLLPPYVSSSTVRALGNGCREYALEILTLIYPMAGAIGLLLGVVHLLIWFRNRQDLALPFAASLATCGGMAAFTEVALISAETVERFQAAVFWQNICVGGLVVSLIWFVQMKLKTGRLWLAIGLSAMWGVGLIANVVGPGNLTFASISDLSRLVAPWGESFTVAQGEPHPLKVVVDLATLGIIFFVLDASVTAWRAGRRIDATRVGGSILFFMLVAGIHSPLVDAGVIETPFIVSLAFVAISVALSLGLVDEVARAASMARALEAQQRRWDVLVERVHLAVIRVDRTGRIASVNPFLEKLVGRNQQALQGTDPRRLAPTQAQDEISAALKRLTEGMPSAGVRRGLLGADGVERELAWFSVPLTDAAGAYDGFISVGEDLTEREDARNEVQRAREEIERMGRGVILGELAASFAHELSQPIGAILSNVQTLKVRNASTGVDAVTEEIVADIVKDIRRARDLMVRIRGMITKENDQFSPLDPAATFAEVLEMVQPQAKRHRVSIDLVGPEPGESVLTSKLALQQIAMNLILNGVHAAGASGVAAPRVVLRWRLVQGFLELVVDDNGPGLPPDIADTIFDPFFTTKPGGMGIGLAVSRRIIEGLKGTIAATESPNGGARFEVLLPLGPPAFKTEERHAAAE